MLRVDKAVPDLPAWWNVGGTAFHAGVELYERARVLAGDDPKPIGWDDDETARRFRELFDGETRKLLAESDVPMPRWRAASSGKEGQAWWQDKGPEMLVQYVRKQAGRPERLVVLGDVLGLEIDFVAMLGGVETRMIVDQILWNPARQQLVVRDLKSGSRLPADPLQLQAYAIGLQRTFGPQLPSGIAQWVGRYWDARKAVEASERVLDRPEQIAATDQRMAEFDRAERAGMYLVHPSNFCVSCSARSHCPVMAGISTSRKDQTSSLRFDA